MRPRTAKPFVGIMIAMLIVFCPGVSSHAQAAPAEESAADTVRADSALGSTSVVLLDSPWTLRGNKSPEQLAYSGAGTVDTQSTGIDNLAVRPKRHHILLGMGVGVVAGASIGYLWGKATCHDGAEGPPCELGNRAGAVWCGIIGLAVGGVVGGFVHRSAPKQRLPRISVGAAPLGSGGVVLALSIR
jgi:hypothetical protein